MTRTGVLIFALALAGAVAAQAGFAAAPAPEMLGLSGDKPIAVNADSFSADLKAETGTYRGNVIVTQGDVRLHADEVTVAAPGGKAARMEAHGHVVVDSPSGQAVGDAGDYDVAAQVLHLNGHVVLTKDQNVMRGGQLVVSMANGEAHLTGSGEAAPGQPQGRVQALFVPADKNQNGQPNAAQPPSAQPAQH
jgi:lipopolysaccharide export system protein LptA